MKRLKIKLAIYLLLFAVLSLIYDNASFAQFSWLTYRHDDLNIRFLYPPDWRFGTPRGSNVVTSLYSPIGKPDATCNLLALRTQSFDGMSEDELNHNIKTNQFSASEWTSMFIAKWPDIKVLRTSLTSIDNRPAYYADIEYSHSTLDKKKFIHGSTAVTFTAGYMWQFTCAGKGDSMQLARTSYKLWDDTLKRIMGSLVFETWK